MINPKGWTLSSVAVATLMAFGGSAQAIELLSGFGGDAGLGELAMVRNDDGSSNQLALPFAIDFFGNTYNSFFVNNNGNITFNRQLGSYTPQPFPIASQPMIAPYWGDVDTRGGGAATMNNVWVASPNNNTVVVTWDKVGYYGSHTDKLNSFQMVLSRSNTGAGDFDVEFRYNQLQWTTGDASGGAGGLGGTPAQAGYDAGNGTNYYTLPGSRTADVLNLVNTSNVASDSPGLWQFAIRNGLLPGSSASNPIMPTYAGGQTEPGWSFNFGVQLNQTYWIDPEVAIGYNFIANSGPNFASFVLPDIGDGQYELWLWYGDQWLDTNQVVAAGDVYTFGRGGVDRFSIRGIETGAALDPNDPNAFVVGLTFTGGGTADISMIPITAAVPEPESYALMLAGLAMLGVMARRRRSRN